MQHQPLQLRHILVRDSIAGLEMRKGAEHPAQRIAQFSVRLRKRRQHVLADAQIVGIIRGRHPQAQNIRARILDDGLRRDDIADRLRHFAAVLVEHEPMRQHGIIGRAPARAAALQQGGMKPAAMLIGSFQIHDFVASAVADAVNIRKARKVFRIFQSEGVCRAGIKPHVENVIDFFVLIRAVLVAQKALRGARRIPGVGALHFKRGCDALIHLRVEQNFMAALFDEHADRHAPRALARYNPVGPVGDHAGDAVFASRRHPARFLDRGKRDIAKGGGVVAALPMGGG